MVATTPEAIVAWRRRHVGGLLWTAMILGIAAAALTARVVLDGGAGGRHEAQVMREIQEHATLLGLARPINDAGSHWWLFFGLASVLLLTTPFFLHRRFCWCPERSEAAIAFTAGLLLHPLNGILKLVVESPRPGDSLGLFVDQAYAGYGFPSGHVYNSVLFYGIIAIYAPVLLGPRLAWPVRLGAVAVAFLAGWARIVVGAHWPTDVLGGYLWGLAILCLVVAFARWASLQPWAGRRLLAPSRLPQAHGPGDGSAHVERRP